MKCAQEEFKRASAELKGYKKELAQKEEALKGIF